jgi:hypothetical protein
METTKRSIEMAETAMETDGDGSGGTFPSRQGAGTETSVPRNSSVTAVKLWNCSGNFAHSFRVFRREASYRRRGVIRRRPGWPHNIGGRGQGLGYAPLLCGQPLSPLWLSFSLWYSSGKNKTFKICFVQFQEYFLCSISKIQK